MKLKEAYDHFIEVNSRAKVVENPAVVIAHVRSWTNQEPYLTDLILKLVLEQSYEIPNGQEEYKVKEFVEKYIIKDWESGRASEHLTSIQNEILRHPQKAKILLKLHEILNAQRVSSTDNVEVKTLRDSGLVVAEGTQLKIHNDIYSAVFDQEWIAANLNSANQAVLSTPPKGSRKGNTYLNTRSLSVAAAGVLSLGLVFWGGTYLFGPEPSSHELPDPSPIPGPTVEEWLSSGETILVAKEEIGEENSDFRNAKEQGIDAFAAGDYESAYEHFKQALIYYKNAPETLIYMNNALANIDDEFSASGESHTIAITVPITVDIPSSQAMLRGVAQAQDQVNRAGGINGVPLEVVIVDFSDADNASKVVSTISNRSDILGVVGSLYSGITLGAAEFYKEQQLPTISLGTSVDISQLNNEYVFRISPSDAITGKNLARYMLNGLNKDRAAVFYNADSAYSSSLKSVFTDEVFVEGGDVVREFDWSTDDFDPQQALQQAVDAGAEVLMLVPQDVAELEEKAFPVAQLNSELDEPRALMGGDGLYQQTVITETFEGAVVGAPWHLDAHLGSPFVTQSEQLWGADINWMSAMAYDAAQVWIEAISQSGTSPTRASLQQILVSPEFTADGATDEISFNRARDRNTSVQLVEVGSASDGRFTSIGLNE